MIIGIDLLWVRPQINGGGESYIRNLLDGFKQYSPDNTEYCLFVSIDNQYTFEKYFNSKIFTKILCNINSNKPYKRIIWENLKLNRLALKHNIDLMFVPVYSKPIYKTNRVKYIITIHDLQALHYPEYFTKLKYIWLKFAWKRCAKTSDKIIAISSFVKDDLTKNLKIDSNKIEVIYNSIVKSNKSIDFTIIKDKYNVIENNYFYTVSSMTPHKNLKTIINVIKRIKEENIKLPNKLVISGVGGNGKEELLQLIKEFNIEENVIMTEFVSDEERDCLYKNASAFLFPSIFEGFGMPPIEAMMLGTPVVACSIEVIREVSESKATYVEKYFDVDEWIEKIQLAYSTNRVEYIFEKYSLEKVTKEYEKTFRNITS
ncbi:glycosyltransferase family 4 protein [Clostridium estertheticum]|uniref:glycosyltransferase family 4 protein n=1 Tax=Clostridium estertheticum TaxID=238834 RepID=UPI001CF2BE1C|nr:glycosyltransferase family 1 protein [Clostridium estertheticum]MCB2353558.1 glycosyltransferase family 4 protein [Clostridium estertheticum]WAG41893.1 glycosyltransferase family 4 protein [Clostridium estertheticum]